MGRDGDGEHGTQMEGKHGEDEEKADTDRRAQKEAQER